MPFIGLQRRSASPAFIQQLILVLAAAAMFLSNLGATALWDLDEALYSSIAREMGQRGDWIVPMFNGSLFPEKPPLMFWLMMGSFKVFGVNEFAARLPAVLLAIGTALATYHLARRLFSANVGFWAGLIVSSNIIFTVSARAATVDSALTFLTTMVMLLFVRGTRVGISRELFWDGQGKAPAGALQAAGLWNQSALCRPLASHAVAIGLLLGLAILAKGPIGFILPAGAATIFALIMTRSIGGTMRLLRPFTVLAVAAAVALPWFVLVARRTDGEWLAQFIGKYNLRPFNSPFLGHRGPWFYHFAVVLVGLFPWSVFLGPTIAHAWRSIRAGGPATRAYALLVAWVVVFFGFWSVCSTKLPHYVLPAYPALAILTACFLDGWLKNRAIAPRYVMPTATGIMVFVGAAMIAVLPWVAARYAPGEGMIALVGLELVIGGGAAAYFLARDRRPAYLTAIAATSVMFIVVLFAWAALRIDRHQPSRPLLAAIHDDHSAAVQLAGYKYCDASTVYYAGSPVTRLDNPDALRHFIAAAKHPYVITTGDDFRTLESQSPGEWRVVARRPRFLAKGEIVALAPQAAADRLSQREEERERR